MEHDLKVNGKTYTLNLPDVSVDGERGGHPLYYIFKQPNATANYLEQISSLMHNLPRNLNVFEFCGGVGIVPMVCWDILKPASWTAVDLDPDCIKHYQCQDATPVLGDMYTTDIATGTDMIVCDFPNNTLPKMWREPKRMELLKRIADFGPTYWEITDVGYYWIHLPNHWPLYGAKFGVQPTRENYHVLFDRFMRENYGYKVIKWAVGGGAQYFLMEKC